MKRLLKEILYRSRIEDVIGHTDRKVQGVKFDSRKVEAGDLFVAIRGTQMDGHEYIDQAVENGALFVVCEEMPLHPRDEVTYVKVKDSQESLGFIASEFYDNPSGKLQLVGVTGTNGKTTVVTLLYHLFRKLGYKTGMLSTVVNMVNEEEVPALLTTPDPVTINELLFHMVEEGCNYAFMEVSSHAIKQKRVTGLSFAGGVFTNITHEHLDYHKDFQEYLDTKKELFDGLTEKAFALVNWDDKHGETMLRDTKAKKWSFGVKTMANIKGKVLENQFSGLEMNIDGNDLFSCLIGGFNAYNILAVYGVAQLLGEEQLEVLTAISALNPVEGRFQYFKTDEGVTAIVDFAHSPDALENVLKTIKEVRTGNEQVITVVGCGGDRDRAKRPEMARIASEYSDKLVLTSDNPRSEDPSQIIEEMKTGLNPISIKKTFSITDRREGIRTACQLAADHDIILVAGKGHEKYQEVQGEKLPFDDLEILKETLKTSS